MRSGPRCLPISHNPRVRVGVGVRFLGLRLGLGLRHALRHDALMTSVTTLFTLGDLGLGERGQNPGPFTSACPTIIGTAITGSALLGVTGKTHIGLSHSFSVRISLRSLKKFPYALGAIQQGSRRPCSCTFDQN